MNCTICNNNNLISLNPIICRFTKLQIQRYSCFDCDLIFGPLDYINLPFIDLINKYKEIYTYYNESDSTALELKTFFNLHPFKYKSYLNFGSGDWSRSSIIISNLGYNLDCYDILFSNIPLSKNYNGIFSNNVLEHLQNPIKTFQLFNSLLNLNDTMVHATPCYNYCYEDSIFHLYFYLGKSIDLLSNFTGFKIIKSFSSGKDFQLKVFQKIRNLSNI